MDLVYIHMCKHTQIHTYTDDICVNIYTYRYLPTNLLCKLPQLSHESKVISACEKGGAWDVALHLLAQMSEEAAPYLQLTSKLPLLQGPP